MDEIRDGNLWLRVATEISNQNPYDITIGNIFFAMSGESSGTQLTSFTVPGMTVSASKAEKTPAANISLPLSALNEKTVATTLQTEAGIEGITVPVTATIITQMPKLSSLIQVPSPVIGLSINGIQGGNLTATANINITNNNNFTMTIGTLNLTMLKADGTLLGSPQTFPGMNISASSSQSSTYNVSISLSALNETTVTTILQTSAGIDGIPLIPINATIITQIPKLSSLIKMPLVEAFVTIYPPQLPPAPPKPWANITVNITNNNTFNLTVSNITIKLSDAIGVLANGNITGGTLVALSVTSLYNKSPFYLGLPPFPPNYVKLELNFNVGLEGVHDPIPIDINATIYITI